MTSDFLNPYSGLIKAGDAAKVQTMVSREHKLFFRRVGDHGTETTVINLLYYRFIQACQDRGIVDYEHRDKLYEFASRFVIALPEDLKRKAKV